MKKLFFLLLLIFFIISPVNSSQLVNRVVALVDGETITLFELQARVKQLLGLFENVNIDDLPESQLIQTQRQVLNQMINDILLKKEADRFGIEVTRREVDNHIDQVRAEQNMGQEEFEQFLQSQGFTLDIYRKQVSDSILRQRVLSLMVRRKVLVTMEEIEAHYRDNISQYQEEKKVHLKVIILPDIEDAVRIREQIARGEFSFDDAAARFSQGPNSSGGGDLGFIEWKRLAPEWRQALDNLEQGKLSDAFQIRESGALLKLIESRSEGAVELSEVEDKIREKLFQAKLDRRFDDYISSLREKAVIDVRL